MDNLPFLNPGERASIAGRSGSGKSTLARWMLMRSPGHWVILNPKHTSAYKSLPDSNTLKGVNLSRLENSMMDYRFTIVNPTAEQATASYMDALVSHLHQTYQGIGLCVDELYSLHQGNARAGEGLTGWLTRGRELKQSFLGLTQRPAWVSKFIFSEGNYIGGMSLVLPDDRKKMYEYSGRDEFLLKLEPRQWLWYSIDNDSLRHFGPVPPN